MLIALLAVVIVVAVFTVVAFYVGGCQTGWSWLIALLSTLVSAMLAIVAGFFLFMFQVGATQRDRKQEMAQLLRHELEELLIAVQENRDPKHSQGEVPRFPLKPKRSEIKDEVLLPENHETHFPYRFLYSRFLELVYESGVFGGWLEIHLSDLIKAIQEYNTQAQHLRALALSASLDGSEQMRKRY